MPGLNPENEVLVLVCAGLFGAMFGSFLNVVILRLPEKKSLVWPGSSCPKCGAKIRSFDNVPILSWLILGGRCRDCRAPISVQYPIVEALTAALTLATAWRFLLAPAQPDWARFAAAELLVLALVPVTFIDLRLTIIPDRITKPGMVAGPLLSLAAPALHRTEWLTGEGLSAPVAALLLSLLGMAAGAGSIWGMGVLGTALFRKDAMGFGDVKLMGMAGAFVGPVGVLLAILIGCVIGSVGGILAWLVTRSRYIPFGPFLSAGTVIVLFFYDEVWHFITVTYPGMFS
jgi:leader peptidase (prepilin peptidase)/N-methyltransferase